MHPRIAHDDQQHWTRRTNAGLTNTVSVAFRSLACVALVVAGCAAEPAVDDSSTPAESSVPLSGSSTSLVSFGPDTTSLGAFRSNEGQVVASVFGGAFGPTPTLVLVGDTGEISRLPVAEPGCEYSYPSAGPGRAVLVTRTCLGTTRPTAVLIDSAGAERVVRDLGSISVRPVVASAREGAVMATDRNSGICAAVTVLVNGQDRTRSLLQHVEGAEPESLSHRADECSDEPLVGFPAVSPDGRRIAVLVAPGDQDGSSRLNARWLPRVVEVTSAESTEIDLPLVAPTSPSFSPSGDRLVLGGGPVTGRDLFVVDLRGEIERCESRLPDVSFVVWTSEDTLLVGSNSASGAELFDVAISDLTCERLAD